MGQVKAQRREEKKRKKMNVHGRGIKSQPMRGIPKAAKHCFRVLLFLCFIGLPVVAQAQSETPRLFIISPAPGEVVLSQSKEVRFIADAPEKLAGHLRVWLDASSEHDKSLSILLSDKLEYTFKDATPGLHTIYAEFLQDNDESYNPPLTATVDFETIGEEIKPAPIAGEETDATPEFLNGLFLPPGQGNTILTIVLIALAILILWYIFKHPRKKHD